MRRISITVLLVFLSTAVWAQFEHPDLKSGKTAVKSLVIVPPNVKIVKNGVKSVEEMVDESRAIENALPPLISEALNKRHCEVNDKAFAGEALEKDEELKYAVADLQKRFDEILPQLQKKPKDVRKGRFTMGDEVAKVNPGGAVDALVFVRGYGQVVSGGKAFLSAMAHTYNYSGAIYYIAVVDAHNGNVLYYGMANNGTGSPAKKPEGAKKSLEKFFKNFPEATAKS
ncbi:MAG TPA: DUF4136 domain-containing protein [Candidatus Angelobacter sp.]|nr:DUF4136 domain-containing protein [Candidatus Angelobacter sp.]